jgi:hypothetical protein
VKRPTLPQPGQFLSPPSPLLAARSLLGLPVFVDSGLMTAFSGLPVPHGDAWALDVSALSLSILHSCQAFCTGPKMHGHLSSLLSYCLPPGLPLCILSVGTCLALLGLQGAPPLLQEYPSQPLPKTLLAPES